MNVSPRLEEGSSGRWTARGSGCNVVFGWSKPLPDVPAQRLQASTYNSGESLFSNVLDLSDFLRIEEEALKQFAAFKKYV